MPAPDSGPDPLVGQTIDRFRIDGRIGKGSMGIVYGGVEVQSGARVAIKTMDPQHAKDDELLQRFQREARVGGQIRHPHVARVYTVGVYSAAGEPMPYLVMEFIDGPSLQDLVRPKGEEANKKYSISIKGAVVNSGQLPEPKVSCEIIRQAAMGLKEASSKGTIHRDIKPANIMMNSRGEVKLVDFGIARDHSHDQLRTAVGVVLGSPYYMSPEQSAAQPLDLRSDIYGLGATFYFMLTGNPPFEGKNLVEIIQKRARNDLRPIQQVNANVPRRVVDVVTKMMQPDPYDRFQNYDDLIAAIDDAMTARAEPVPIASAIAAAAAAQGVQSAAPARPRPAPPPPQRPIEIPPAWYESRAAQVGMILVALGLIGAALYIFFQ